MNRIYFSHVFDSNIGDLNDNTFTEYYYTFPINSGTYKLFLIQADLHFGDEPNIDKIRKNN